MGTRGAYGFHKGGRDKITYNHFDSYPTGLGADVAEFVKNHTDEELNEIFDRIILVKSGDAPSKEQIKECFRFYRPGVSMNTPEEWYSLLRAAQGDLEAHARGLRYMIDNADFLRDSLFCEWGYVINLDKGVLEVYRGFQKAPSKNRYYNPFSNDGYYNCALIREVSFETLREPNTYMATLEDEIEPDRGGDI